MSSIPSTDVIQLILTLKITTAQVVETSVTVNNNSPIQDYVDPDDHILNLLMNPRFKTFHDLNKSGSDIYHSGSLIKIPNNLLQCLNPEKTYPLRVGPP